MQHPAPVMGSCLNCGEAGARLRRSEGGDPVNRVYIAVLLVGSIITVAVSRRYDR